MSKRRVIRKAEESAVVGRNPQWLYIAGGFGGIALIGLLVLMVQAAMPPAEVRPTPTPVAEIAGLVQAATPPSAAHDDNLVIPFGELPPMGGTHHSIWQNCGIYVNPVQPQHAVHSLEHGAVWITYQPDLAQTTIDRLVNQVRDRRFVLVSPYPNQRSPIVMTAWGLQLELDAVDDERFMLFLNTFEKGPQTPEPGATCQGGLGFTN